MDLKEMNYGEIKKLLTTDDKGVAAQTLQEIHSAVLKAPSRRGAALKAEQKLKKISENEIDFNENQRPRKMVKKNGYSRKAANEKGEDAPFTNPVRSNEFCLLSSSDDSCDEDAEICEEGHRHSDEVLYSSDNEVSSNDPSSQKKKSLQEQSSSSDPTSDEDQDDEWSATDAMLCVMKRHETTLSSLPDWRKYAVPRLDLPDLEKDFEESTRKALDSPCLSCKNKIKNDCRCLARDVLGILEKKKF